jgi:hypothetical protein
MLQQMAAQRYLCQQLAENFDGTGGGVGEHGVSN